MKIRIARHVKAIEPMVHFYSDLLGLEVIKTFKQHNGYDGVIMGYKTSDWEIEFTKSTESPMHTTDEDDLLILKYDDIEVYRSVIEKLSLEKNIEFAPRNPFWEDQGKLFKDPEGYGVVVIMQVEGR